VIIKYEPGEFRVRERSIIGHKKNDCLVAEVEKDNWDTTLLIKEMAKALGISQKSIGYAGLKDKASVSIQSISFFGVDEEKLQKVRIPGVTIRNMCRGDRINIGDLDGNDFDIVARDLTRPLDVISSDLENTLDKLHGWHGFLNYFGYQRFGLQRPVTAEVGKHIVKKDYESAALTYIGKPYPLDPHADVRRELLEDLDFKRAYEEFPKSLRFERAMLFSLAHEGKGYLDCFKSLPERLLKLFVHAYQSKLFNDILLKRTEHIPPNEPELGDHILMDRYERKASTTVNSSNLGRVRGMLEKNVSVSAPLIGHRTRLPKTAIGDIARDLMEKEEIVLEDFKNDDLRAFESSGAQREILARFDNLSYALSTDDIFGNVKCDLAFFLKKGEYATELLRQLFNEEAIPQRLEMT